jgi:hypothetical protein
MMTTTTDGGACFSGALIPIPTTDIAALIASAKANVAASLT